MAEITNLTNHFLIAMPTLEDINFSGTVTLICEHNEEGAMGIVINRPTDFSLGELLQQLDMIQDADLYSDTLALTTSKDIRQAIAEDRGPERRLIALGYAGWGTGQLEQEISANAWLTTPADKEILFDLPSDKRWEAAAAKLGIDLTLLSSETGHA